MRPIEILFSFILELLKTSSDVTRDIDIAAEKPEDEKGGRSLALSAFAT